jgi:chorismate mutase
MKAEFFASVNAFCVYLRQEVEKRPDLSELCAKHAFTIGFVRTPFRQNWDVILPAIAGALLQTDWTQTHVLYVSDNALRRFVSAINRRNIDKEAPVKCALHVNEVPVGDHVPAILGAIEQKKAKTYSEGPLHLAITAVEALDAVIPRVAKHDIDLGQFEKILITDTQDVIVYERAVA